MQSDFHMSSSSEVLHLVTNLHLLKLCSCTGNHSRENFHGLLGFVDDCESLIHKFYQEVQNQSEMGLQP